MARGCKIMPEICSAGSLRHTLAQDPDTEGEKRNGGGHSDHDVQQKHSTEIAHIQPQIVQKGIKRTLWHRIHAWICRLCFWRSILDWVRRLCFCEYAFLAENDTMWRVILLEVLADDHPIRLSACALFDTGCPINIMSRNLARQLGYPFSGIEGEPILGLLHNDPFKSVGQIPGRWLYKDNRHCPTLSFDPKFYQSTWYVSETDEPVDIIIGLNTIIENKMMKLKMPFAAPAFRSPPRDLDRAAVKDAHKKQEAAIQLNLEKRKQYEATKAQSQAKQASTS